MNTFDVAVIGLGPVGELAALLLARAGLTVLALEREADVYPNPRVGVLDGEALRTLQKAGVYERSVPDMLLGAGAQWVSARGKVVATTLPTEQLQGHPWISAIYQPLLDKQLRAALAEYPDVDIRLGHQLTGLTQDDEGVELTFRDIDGGTGNARARFVVGCDGANSTTRAAIGVELAGSGYTDTWLIIDAKLPEPVTHLPYFQMTLDPAAPRLTGRLAAGGHRWERKVMPWEDRDELLTPRAARQVIAEDADPDTAEILRHLIYTFRAESAEHWRVGRVLLCGDAAHLMPPMIGQGLNSGIRDVTNLTWKIAAVVNGGAPLRILDSYEAERRPHADAITTMSVQVGRLVTMQSRWAAAIRDAVGVTLLRVPPLRESVRQGRWRPPARYRSGLLLGQPSLRSPVGRLFPQPLVRTFSGAEHRLDDISGSGWRIIGWDADPRDALSKHGHRIAQDVLGATYVTLISPGQRPVRPGSGTQILEDLHELSRPYFRRQPFVVLRPDHYICANPSSTELDRTLRKLMPQISDESAAQQHTEAVERTGVWRLDPATADIRFFARGLWGLLPVTGRFSRASGSLTWGKDGSATVLLELHSASIATGLGMRDRHLCAPEFLDVRNHPLISFHGDAVSRGPRRLAVVGKLTVRGTTTEMHLEVELEPDGPDIVAATTARIDLSAYGFAAPLDMVHPGLDLDIRGRLILADPETERTRLLASD
ncbi:bifunctional 3-(3-hydroxy-phenyl)propionate/3-hydroxycinnamic acid hydroxylase [Nocardia violaceofusca]|uniref:bifunctional 3-(3-hydroxy-phenyl)propionate/3-hydroxycinnamic acid hydroxylase n=1 Tax=Nocardia violaceofusca TaxID=941182 RepID=UPI0007A4E5DF|nr:bifunctional 3-(3-hydroxy-phenyl)propionate/3-hydroxycinnamic acid hydroxylase [Nocardia violaceofusca]